MDNSEDIKSKPSVRESYWKEEEEDLLRQWADKAQCYQWLHMRARDIYQRKNSWYTIPVIVISTFVGTASFAQERFPEEDRKYVAMGVGSLSIVAGVISTISQFLKVSELNEAHRVAALSWGKFYRSVKTEITRHPLDRTCPTILINTNKEEFDRLVEISPPLPKKVVAEFNRKFKRLTDLTKPEICDSLMPTQAYEITPEEREEIIKSLVKTNKKIKKKEETQKLKSIEDKYRETFFSMNGRYPDDNEIQLYKNKLKKAESNESVAIDIEVSETTV